MRVVLDHHSTIYENHVERKQTDTIAILKGIGGPRELPVNEAVT
jgi:hypothetical protein